MDNIERTGSDSCKIERGFLEEFKRKADEEVYRILEEIRINEVNFKATKQLDVLNNDKEWNRLGEQVRKFDGNLRIFIHPTHVSSRKDEVDDGTFSYLKYPPTKMLIDIATKESAPPVLILEDEDGFDKNRKAYEEIAKGNKYNPNMFIMPTIHNNGFLKLVDIDPPERDKDNLIDKDTLIYGQFGIWRLITRFHEQGVKKILIAGSSLEVDTNYLCKCVGTFINYLKQLDKIFADSNPNTELIKIQVSTATSPHGRKELREKGYIDLL